MPVSVTFGLLYPSVALAGITNETVGAILALAENHRPMCLKPALADEAVAHYAAHLLQTGGYLPQQRETKREKEGDVEVEYVISEGGGSSSSQTPYQRWEKLAKMCRGGASIVVSNAHPLPHSSPWEVP